MKKFGLLCLVYLLVPNGALQAGQEVGNGGDAVVCEHSQLNSFSGYYALDFLAKFDATWPVFEAATLDEALNRLEAGIAEKIPELAASFRKFRTGLFNETNFSHTYIWERAAFGLVDLKDERIAVQLPANCRNGDDIRIVQAVIRQSPEFSGLPQYRYRFSYVPEVVTELLRTNATQLSFLLVHEWLWEFSGSVERNRTINYWLHSTRLTSWSRQEWEQNVSAIGLALPGRDQSVWSENACLPDLGALNTLKTHSGPDRFRVQVIGKGNAFKRVGTCYGEGQCVYRDDSGRFAADYGLPPEMLLFWRTFSDTSLNELIVGNTEDGSEISDLFCYNTVGAEDVTGLCSITLPGTIDRINLIPTVGQGCITYRARVTKRFNVEEYVLYFETFK